MIRPCYLVGRTTGLLNRKGFQLFHSDTECEPTKNQSDFCSICEPGHKCNVELANKRMKCPEAVWSSSEEPCIACPGGSFQPQAGQVFCNPCPAGYYCPAASVKKIECPKGNFCKASVASPTECKAGSFQEHTAQSVCNDCPAGSFCNEGSAAPTSCPVGHYCPAKAKDKIPCDAGSYQVCEFTITVENHQLFWFTILTNSL